MSELGIFDSELVFQTGEQTVSGFLQDFGQGLKDKLRKSLQDKQSTNTTRNLWQSIQFKVEFQSLGVYRFQLFMDDYGDFIDRGVEGVGGEMADGTPWRKHKTDGIFSFKSGGFPPPVNRSSLTGGSLRQWAERKGLNPYAVQKSIFHKGIKANHFFQDVVNDKLLADMKTSLEEVGAKGIELELVDILRR
jgi:hypothetical protein